MKFEIYRTSDQPLLENDIYEKEFNTLEELLEWIKEIGIHVIINEDKTIEIYDSYRE